MLAELTDTLESDWTELGVLFACAPSGRTPDVERVLLETARFAPEHARLPVLCATWLVRFGHFVARRRLVRLIGEELGSESQAVLGLIVEEALTLGAPRELRAVCDACRPLSEPMPLQMVHREHPLRREIAERNASRLSRKWNVHYPTIELELDAIRPAGWLVDRHPGYRARIARRGDLRVSILETLRRDVPGHAVSSEAELMRLCGATRSAVHKALLALELEGEITMGVRRDGGSRSIRLKATP